MILYHGSPTKTIKSFEKNKVGKNSTIFGSEDVVRHGIFFTPNKDVAQGYAGPTGKVYSANISMKNPFDMRSGVSEKMENDFVQHGGSTKWLYNHEEPWEKLDGESGHHFVNVLKRAGYDGVIFHEHSPHDGMKHESHVVFDPEQITLHESSTESLIPFSQWKRNDFF